MVRITLSFAAKYLGFVDRIPGFRQEASSPWDEHMEDQFAARGFSRTVLAISFCRSKSCRRRRISSGERRSIFE
jgi:hypothetical protein